MQNNKMYGVSSWIWCGITPCWTVDGGGGGARFEVALNNKLRWWRAMQSNPMNTKLPPFVPVRQCLTNVWHGQLECAPLATSNQLFCHLLLRLLCGMYLSLSYPCLTRPFRIFTNRCQTCLTHNSIKCSILENSKSLTYNKYNATLFHCLFVC